MHNPNNTSSIATGLFTRDGHVTLLSLDRFEAGELPTFHHELIIDHLDDCERCSERWREMQGEELGLTPPPQLSRPAASPVAARVFGVVATVVAAAAVLLILWPHPQQASRQPAMEGAWMASPYTSTSAEPDMALVTGGADVSVFAETDEAAPLDDGARVPADEQLSIELKARDVHYTAVVVTRDEPDNTFDESTGGIQVRDDFEVLLGATRLQRGQHRTVVLDRESRENATEFSERIVVLMCEEDFSIVVGDDLDQKSTMPGCRGFEFALQRYAEIADS